MALRGTDAPFGPETTGTEAEPAAAFADGPEVPAVALEELLNVVVVLPALLALLVGVDELDALGAVAERT
jgi:hypothetical protein